MQLVVIERDGTVQGIDAIPDVAKEALAMTVEFYGRAGFAPPWGSYIALEEDVPVGACGFKGAPKEGRVEIAYFTFPGGENRGVATRVAALMIEIAKVADPSVVVTARTLVEPNASHRVLIKSGFRNAGVVVDPEDGEVLEWVYEGR